MSLSGLEKETILLFNEAEQTAEIEVFNARLKRRLEQLHKERPDDVKSTRQTEHSVFYTFPKSWIKINPPRQISEAQREQLARTSFKSQ